MTFSSATILSLEIDEFISKRSTVDVSQMPLLVIQEMKSEFINKDKESSTHLKHQGGLNPKHSDFISHVHVVHPCFLQLYVAKELHLHPHYSIAPTDLDLFRSHCFQVLEDEHDYIEYTADQSYLTGSFLQIWNGGSPEFRRVAQFFFNMDLEKKMYPMFDDPRPIKNARNNTQINGGFTGVSQKKNPGSGVHEAKPQLLQHTEDFADHMAEMSNLARELKLDFVETLENAVNDDLLNLFHRTIHDDSLFVGCTAGLYTNHLQYLLMHVDSQNAKQDGHNVQMVASAIFLGHDTQTKRVFFAVYGRECCNNY